VSALTRFRCVTVVGCGLIGGSFALALRRVDPTAVIAGWDTSTSALTEARRLNAIDKVDDELASGRMSKSDLIYLAMPVQAITDFVSKAGDLVRSGAVITDAGSTKVQICRAARECPPHGAAFIGGHPIAGSERSGIANARADLFAGAPYVLIGEPDDAGCRPLTALLRDMGARVTYMTAAQHDLTLAMSSHLPQLVSTALAATMSSNVRLTEIRGIAGPGLRDMTRLANSPWDMWRDILETNSANIATAIDEFLSKLQTLRDELERDERKHFKTSSELFAHAQTFACNCQNLKKHEK
jgi:prephenate dehydrogenase